MHRGTPFLSHLKAPILPAAATFDSNSAPSRQQAPACHQPQAGSPDAHRRLRTEDFHLLFNREARYNPGYKITREQLEYLAQRVRKLQDLTKRICEAGIKSYLSA